METLPYEMVLKIGQQLTPEELAHCCGVSKGWREAFNQDWLWKLHCDPALEEPLRTTPSIVEPVFVVPGGENSTLEPLCQWRLAFLREKHLRNNWKRNYHRTESLFELENEVYREFLTNTLVVRWCSYCIQVWDVSADPAVFVAETDPSVVDIAGWINCFVGMSLLVVEQIGSVKVFSVDLTNKSIQLMHDILLNDVKSEPVSSNYVTQLKMRIYERHKKGGLDCVKGNIFVHVNVRRTELHIFDLQTGMKIKEEPCPAVEKKGIRFEVYKVSTSPTSDYVLVVSKMNSEAHPAYNDYCFYSVYDPQKLSFVEGYILTKTRPPHHVPDYGEIHSHYVAVPDRSTHTVKDCHSFDGDALLRQDSKLKIGFYSPGSNDYFLFKNGPTSSIQKFDLSNETTTTIEGPSDASGSTSIWARLSQSYKVFNKKLLAFSDPQFGWYLLLENAWVKCDVPFENDTIINQVFTKVISHDSRLRSVRNMYREDEWYIYHYW